MDTYIPNPGAFHLVLNGVPTAVVNTPAWLTNQTLGITISGVVPKPTTVGITYDGSEPLFKFVSGELVEPFTDFPCVGP